MRFEATKLWKSAFPVRRGDDEAKQRDRLRVAYRQLWSRAVDLSRFIQDDLPGLTLHDERHFEALWSAADMLAGPGFRLNPVEVFVFGSAILLHDAGHTLASYPGGRAELEQTVAWQDNLATELSSLAAASQDGQSTLTLPDEVVQRVLFKTLRVLHAERAIKLARDKIRHNSSGDPIFLIEDSELREHLGETIGLIAASHHWRLRDLEPKLRSSVGAILDMPVSWTVDPIKLACLLRCADAIQFDQARAPDFLYSMLSIRGISQKHWLAQNKIARPTPHRDGKSLVFTSTKAFEPKDADAWWLAFDAITIADRELQETNILLADLGKPTLKFSRVRDANSPERFSAHLEAKGWRPVAADIRISDVERVVSWFGGKALYGRALHVPVRELIQNASDAVRARRALEPEGSAFKGEIVVSLAADKDGNCDCYWLQVEDDGIGMSESTLVGPLLDFGVSFWNSEHLKDEFPGLAAKNLRQTGRFGIGFFSVFMIADRVIVESRRYDRGMETQRSLVFEHGLSLRPLLLQEPQSKLSATISTRVGLLITAERLKELLHPENDSVPLEVTLAELVGRLCPTLDCDVTVADRGKPRSVVHRRAWPEVDAFEWLCQITLPHRQIGADEGGSKQKALLKRVVPFATPVRSGGRLIGRAAINFLGGYLPAVVSSGGLLLHGGSFWYDLGTGYIGCVEQEPPGPRRSGGESTTSNLEFYNDPHISDWASEQAQRLANSDLDEEERLTAAKFVAHLKGDPIPLAAVRLNGKWQSLSDITKLLSDGQQILFIVSDSYVDQERSSLWWLMGEAFSSYRPLDKIELSAWVADLPRTYNPYSYSSIYEKILVSDPQPSNSLFGCLLRFGRAQGLEIEFEFSAAAKIGHSKAQDDKLKKEVSKALIVRSVKTS